MLNEDEVIFELKEYLIKKDWIVFSYKSPGGHGGITIRLNDNKSIVPDMVAFKNGFILCIEAKAEYSKEDEQKLDSLFSNERYLQYFNESCLTILKSMGLHFQENLTFIKTIAYSKGTETPPDFVTLKVNESNNIKTTIGKAILHVPLV